MQLSSFAIHLSLVENNSILVAILCLYMLILSRIVYYVIVLDNSESFASSVLLCSGSLLVYSDAELLCLQAIHTLALYMLVLV